MSERLTTIESKPARRILGYDPQLDIDAYSFAKTADLPRLNALTKFNLETMLGERFNVEISKVNYEIKNGQIFSPLHNEPFLNVIERGRKYRQEHGSQDLERETAEVVGFKKIQQILTDPKFQPGKKVISISPRGDKNSTYQHNFVDIYQKDANGQITMSRVTCKFSYKEFAEAAQKLDPFNTLPQNPEDADFLANPLTYQSFDEILETFSPDEKTIPLNEYKKLIEAAAPLILNYINTLAGKNFTQKAIFDQYHAILNYSDDFILKPRLQTELSSLVIAQIEEIINRYSQRPVRTVIAGCGAQGDSNSSNNSPWSVSEFGIYGKDRYGTLEIKCQECGANYSRIPGKLEENCRFCKGTKGILC